MKNILFITTQYPYPLDNGGKIGAFNGISVLDEKYRVIVLSLSEEKNFLEGEKFFSNKLRTTEFVEPIYHPIHIQKKYLLLLYVLIASFFKRIPYLTLKFKNKKMFRKIDEIILKNRFDILFVDYLGMALYGEYIIRKYKNKFNLFVIKDHNIEYEIFKQRLNNGKFIKKVFFNWIWKLTKKYELETIKKYDLVFTVCDDDRLFLQNYNPNIFSMKPTFNIKPYRKELTDKHKLLYIGTLSWKPNSDGLLWFFENVWVDLRKIIPDITIDIIGGGLKENIFKKYKGVNYRGYVKNIEETYKEFKIFIVPLFEGSGIRIKILEAFNNDIAVISTTPGCDTIGATNEKEIIMADDKESFINGIVGLLENDDKNNKIRKSAKDFLKNSYSLSFRKEEIETIINSYWKD